MIQLQCESCGKHMKAPPEAAGKSAKCPACGHSVYIPSPADEVDELPLAPENEEELRREETLLEERRRLDRILAKEDRAPAEGANPSRGAGNRETTGSYGPRGGATSSGASNPAVEQAVVEYLMAMRDSNLEGAEAAMDILKRYRGEARRIVERLAADQIPPSQLARVPGPVYQGFLKKLRAEL